MELDLLLKPRDRDGIAVGEVRLVRAELEQPPALGRRQVVGDA